MKIRDVIAPRAHGISEDRLSARGKDDGDISVPGSVPTSVRIGGSVVRMHDPSLMPDFLPLTTKPINVNGRKAVLWKGIGVDGDIQTFWSYDTAGIGEDDGSYLQDPLDPEGDTDGPGRMGDQDDIGEGDVVPFRRPSISGDAPNLATAKKWASKLFWAQMSSHYTPEDDALERELEDDLARLGYTAEWDHDDPELNMVITHKATGRQYRMGEDELTSDSLSEGLDLAAISRMADNAVGNIPGAANLARNVKMAAKALSGIGAPLAILAALISGVASADEAKKPQAVTNAISTVEQFLDAYHSAKTEEERCRLANEWYGIEPPNDICDLEKRTVTKADPSNCQDVYITRGANKGRTVRQCADQEIMMPPSNESSIMREDDVWDKPNPVKKHKKLSPADKAAAKARAKRAGREYPNMVDNIWAARR
jgi:hypothetical protein